MKCRLIGIFLAVIFFAATAIASPLPTTNDDDNADDATLFQILRPDPTVSEEYDDDSVDYPILRPEYSDENGSGGEGDNDNDNFVVARPYPQENSREEISAESESGEPEDQDPPAVVARPVAEGIEMSDEDQVALIYPSFRKLVKRAVAREEFDDEEYDDTVVVDAASCEELETQCKEQHNLLACDAYEENCSTSFPDEDMEDIIGAFNDQ